MSFDEASARDAPRGLRIALFVGACGAAIAVLFACTRSAARRLDESRAATTEAPELLAIERTRHPASTPQDFYKAAYQACLGPEHDLADRAAMRARIALEMASLGPTPTGEALIEPLPMDGAPELQARVNLRPLRDLGGDAIDRLLDAMYAAHPASEAGRASLRRAWSAMVPALGDEARALDARLAAQGYPPVHHTPAYRAAHAPAYRVAPLSSLRLVRLAQ